MTVILIRATRRVRVSAQLAAHVRWSNNDVTNPSVSKITSWCSVQACHKWQTFCIIGPVAVMDARLFVLVEKV